MLRGDAVPPKPGSGPEGELANEFRLVARQLVTGATFRVGSLLLTRVVAVARLVVFARLFAPHAIGSAALALACVTIASSFADFGFFPALLRTRVADRKLSDTAFTLSLLAGGVVALAVCLMAPLIASVFPAGAANYLRFLSILILVIPLSFPIVLWQRDLNFTHPAIAAVINEVFVLIGAVASELIFHLHVWSILIGYVVGIVASAAYVWLLAPQRPRFALHREHVRSLVSFGGPYMLQDVNGQVMARGDNLLVARFSGPSQLAYYNFSWNVPTMLGQLAATLEGMLLPVYARLDERRADLLRLFNLTTKMWSLLGSFFGIAAFVFARQLVHLLYGERWDPVVPILRIMLVAFIIRFCTGYGYDNLVMLRGRTRYMMKWGFVNTAMVFTLGLFLISRHGPQGGASFWVIQACILTPLVRLPLIWQELGSFEFVRHAWQPVVAGLAAAATSFGLMAILHAAPTAASTAAAGAAYVVLYFGVLLSIDRQLFRDASRLASLARRPVRP